MSNQDIQNKIYYDVNISYNPTESDSRHYFFSKAHTEIRLNGPLITDPMNYDLAISKFKIDTECLPVFIPEMRQPQPALLPGAVDTGERDTTYKIWLYYPSKPDVVGPLAPVVPADYNGKYSVLEEIVKVVPNKRCVDFEVQNYSIKHRLPTVVSGQNTFAQNTDPDYFYYDYQSFLDRLNRTMETLLSHIPAPGAGQHTAVEFF